jgi:ribosome biogenesis GTPase
MNLNQYGYNTFFEDHFREYSGNGYIAGRVAIQNKSNYVVYSEHGELNAEVSGKMMFDAENKEDYPAVGDWVVMRPLLDEQKAIIDKVLPRQTVFSRKEAGNRTERQILASNIDTVFIMTSLNHDFNLRRLERYMVLALESGVNPVIVLSKADICEDINNKVNETNSIAEDIPVHVLSSIMHQGVDELKHYFDGNKTIAVLGSSGVGKSTFINTLLGEDTLKTLEISSYKDKGHHATTRRELILIPTGGLIVDTPGMRELQLWEGGEGIENVFDDIEELIHKCKFSDCTHRKEPGCAIKEAIENSELDEKRFESYLKMKREARYFESRKNHKANLAEKAKWKKIHKQAKELNRIKFKRRV